MYVYRHGSILSIQLHSSNGSTCSVYPNRGWVGETGLIAIPFLSEAQAT